MRTSNGQEGANGTPTSPTKKRKHDDESAFGTKVEEEFCQPYHCNACQKDLTHMIRIRCAECIDFDLCVTCFSNGKEPAGTAHKGHHPYRVMELLDFAIFEETWGADEELKLVSAVETYGLGNWEQVAEHVGTKNRVECAKHYHTVYIESENFPIPDMTKQFDRSRRLWHERQPPRKIPKAERPPSSVPANHEIQGYMPGRREFEIEVENDAEQAVKDLEFHDSDSPEDTELKLAMFSIYNAALDRRLERKKFAFEQGLTDFRKIKLQEGRRPKDEKELLQKMRVFARMQTRQDFDDLTTGLLNEMRLRDEIAKLQEYRRMGVTSRQEAEIYERDKKERELPRMAFSRQSSRLPRDETSGPPSSRAGSTKPYGTPHPIHATPPPQRPTPPPSLSLTNGRKPLDISSADGLELLTLNEQQLCTQLRLFPKSYLVIKETILKEYAKTGALKRRQCRELIKIDANTTAKIFEFFVQMGWIRTAKSRFAQ
ncbi:hypothetical protein BC832DRAFT_440780 [Gaertneriomyces semiglobifer]|nr:hypothetical protein BC832DRAFT_440780 [Gaertneriomyces semiglobifer]